MGEWTSDAARGTPVELKDTRWQYITPSELAGTALQKTAVVVVHGIGEQRPLDTLLGFVGDNSGHAGILGDTDRPGYVNPDVMSGATYLRRLTFDARDRTRQPAVNVQDRVDVARVVDFYEYYWAYAFRGTTWHHLGSWVLSLLRARRKDMAVAPPVPPEEGNGSSVLRGTEHLRSRRLLNLAVGILLVLIFASGVIAADRRRAWLEGQPHVFVIAMAVLICSCILLVLAMNPLGLISIAHIVCVTTVDALLIALVSLADWSKLNVVQQVWTIAITALLIAIVAYLWACRRFGSAKPPQRHLIVLAFAVIGVAGIAWALWAPLAPGVAILAATLPPIATAGAALTGGILLKGVGDAARYLSNSPDNVDEREKIRQGLVDILHGLHGHRDPRTEQYVYDRVVLVGHSLGSVIAYDALQAYWMTASRDIPLPADRVRPLTGADGQELAPSPMSQADLEDDAQPLRTIALAATSTVLESLETQLPAAPGLGPNGGPPRPLPSVDDTDAWIAAQRALQGVLRTPCVDADDPAAESAGTSNKRWLVTDLMTFGSPLAHAELLLATGGNDLERRKQRNLLAANPPGYAKTRMIAGVETPLLRWPVSTFSNPRDVTSRLLSAAPFASVTWTNVYFSHDLVGGPLPGLFGNGIRDVRLTEAKPYLLNFVFKYPHSSYWPGSHDRPAKPRAGDASVSPDNPPTGAECPLSGTTGSRDLLRRLLIEPAPVLWIWGSVTRMRDFQRVLYVSPPPLAPACADDSVELRLFAIDRGDQGTRRTWLWPGPSPFVDAAGVDDLMQRVDQHGLSVALTARSADGLLD